MTKSNGTPQIDPLIFRQYDIRGIAGEQLTEAAAHRIGQAIAALVLAQNQSALYVARDGRLSSPALSQALCAGILSTGCDVVDLGEIPTPLLYFALHVGDMTSGVMVTGSHNPGQYNGLKIAVSKRTLSGAAIADIRRRIVEDRFPQGAGRVRQEDIVERYLQRVADDIKIKRPLKIVIDCGNGIAGRVAPALYRRLGCEVLELYCDIDGRFPNHHPDPGCPENLRDLIAKVRDTEADLGLAFDGDGDRLGVVTERGDIVMPDRQLILFALDLLKRRPGAQIIYDVKSTRYLDTIIRQAGGVPVMWKTGHSLIKTKLRETGAPLAGEFSGHIFFAERWYGFDDALYAGARLLEIAAGENQPASALFDDIPDSVNTPELKIPVAETEKATLMASIKTQFDDTVIDVVTLDGVRAEFTDGWGLVRESNTTPCLTARFEADDERALQRIQADFRRRLLAAEKTLDLPF